MNPVTELAVEITKLATKLEVHLYGLIERIARNERGILVSEKDINPLISTLCCLTDTLKNSIPEVEKTVGELVIRKSYTDGRLDSVLNIVKMCYEDYRTNGRKDAVDAIGSHLHAIGYTPP